MSTTSTRRSPLANTGMLDALGLATQPKPVPPAEEPAARPARTVSSPLRATPTVPMSKLTIDISVEDHRALKARAAQLGVSIASLIRPAISEIVRGSE